jgi:hypothetical protein
MHTVLCRLAVCSLVGWLLVSATPAQRPSRAFLSNEEAWPLGVDALAHWGVSMTGELIYCDIAGALSDAATSEITAPGGFFVLSHTSAVFCGRTATGQARIEHWTMHASSGKLQMQSALGMAGADFAGLFYRPSTESLYVLDCLGNRILRGAWKCSDSLASTAFVTVVGSATLPFLAEASGLTLVRSKETPEAMNLVRYPMMPRSAFTEILDGSPIQIRHAIDGSPAPDVVINGLTVNEGATFVEAWASAGVAVEVLEVESASSLGFGTAGFNGVVSVTLSQPLVLGAKYLARRAGQELPQDPGVTCVVRHGSPEVFNDGAAVDGFYYQSGATIGQPFTVEVGLRGGGSRE